MAKILFFGPYSPPITGQSLAFKAVVDAYDQQEYVLVDTSRFKSKIFNSLYTSLKSPWLLLTQNNISTVYFTCTRSFQGSIKDSIMLFWAGLLKKRVVNHLHGGDFKDFIQNRKGLYNFFLRKLYRNVDTSIVLTEGMIQEMSDFPKMKVYVVKNFYSDHFERKNGSKREIPIISYFSSIIESKGILDFLQAAKMASEKKPEILFKVAGRFSADYLSSKRSLKKSCNKFREENTHINLQWYEQIDPKNRWDFLSESDILVLPTHYAIEGIPLVIIEAMRCRNAIITTKHKYLPELVNESNGRIVDIQSPHQIADAILELLDDPEVLKNIQEHNEKYALKNYREDKFLVAIKSIIKLS